MAHVTFRLTDREYSYAIELAKFNNMNLSEYFRNLFYKQAEDFEDLKAIEKYENNLKNNPNQKLYTHEEVWGE